MPTEKKPISKKQFEELCKLQCTELEICAVLDVSDKTLNNWVRATYDNKPFSVVRKEKGANGTMSLRRTQFKMAEKYPNMAIWLGKQYLGQKDNPVIIDTSAIEEHNTKIETITALLSQPSDNRNIDDFEKDDEDE